MQYLSFNKGISIDDILLHPDRLWYWQIVINNHDIPWEIIQDNPNIPWDWNMLSAKNPQIKKVSLGDILKENPDKPWCWTRLSYNMGVTFNDVITFLEKPWNWYHLSKNPNITWDIIQSNPNLPWNWDSVSSNNNITWDIIKSNPNLHWNFRYFCYNPNITSNIIEENPDNPWDIYNTPAYYNIRLTLPMPNIIQIAQQYFAACRIQRAFKEAYYNPNYKICRNRLQREFKDMIDDKL
jgi:hypothetical protein